MSTRRTFLMQTAAASVVAAASTQIAQADAKDTVAEAQLASNFGHEDLPYD